MNAGSEKEYEGTPPGDRESNGPRQRHITVTGNSIDSANLFSGAREITITHGSDTYRLRLTSQNKLILTK